MVRPAAAAGATRRQADRHGYHSAMQAALFCPVPYGGPVHRQGWPVPVTDYTADVAQDSRAWAIEQARMAAELGCDWV